MDSVINIVKSYLSVNHPHLIDCDIHVDNHHGTHDDIFVKSPLLPDVTAATVNLNDYQVATVLAKVQTEDGFEIPKILKLTVKDGAVQKALESK